LLPHTYFSLLHLRPPLYPPSFPTRRSSDLPYHVICNLYPTPRTVSTAFSIPSSCNFFLTRVKLTFNVLSSTNAWSSHIRSSKSSLPVTFGYCSINILIIFFLFFF